MELKWSIEREATALFELLIAPYGIEIHNDAMGEVQDILLLIAPYGIEIQ